MNITSVAVGIPVSDLAASCQWYERALGLTGPDLEPTDDVVEYAIGGDTSANTSFCTWLQLGQENSPTPGRWVFRLGVPDVSAERQRLLGLGIAVGELIVVKGAVTYCEFADPDGNLLSYYTEADDGS
jgi:catechol 2,3-dioxygenase-like lactoylglutathione lyase family enzyme